MRLLRKRILGIPVGVIVAMAVTASTVAGAFFWQAETPSQVRVVGESVGIYEEQACITPLTSLDFGEVRQGEVTATISSFLRNEGNLPLYIAVNQTNLDAELTLYEGGTNVVPGSPANLLFGSGWAEIGTTTEVATALGTGELEAVFCVDNSAFPGSGVVKVDDELILYGLKYEEPDRLDELTRGYNGTTPADHNVGATVTLMGMELAPGVVLEVPLHLEASGSASLDTYTFTTTFYAQDSPF